MDGANEIEDDTAESVSVDSKLGIDVVAEIHGVPNTNIVCELINNVEAVKIADTFAIVKAAGEVTVAEIDEPNEVPESDVVADLLDEGGTMLVGGDRK